MYGTMNPPLHVSGHGSVEELKLVLNLVPAALLHADPRRIPAAFQARPAGRAPALRRPGRDLRHGYRATSWKSTSTGARKAGKVTVGRVCIDSGSVDDVVQDMVIRDRRHLSEDGIVLPIIAINRHTGRMESLPEIVSRGFAVGRGRLRLPASGAAGGGQDPGGFQPGGEDRLGRDEGKDPRRPEALHREGDLAAAADHAGDSGSVSLAESRPSTWRMLPGLQGGTPSASSYPWTKPASPAPCAKPSPPESPVTIAGRRHRASPAARVPFGGWVLSLEKFTRLEVRPGYAVVGAGVLLRDLHAAAARGRPVLSAGPHRDGASIGGNIACNASGSRSFRLRRHRRAGWNALRVVLADGRSARRLARGEAIDFDPGHGPAARRHQEYRRLPAAPGHGLGGPVRRLRRHAGRDHRGRRCACCRRQAVLGGVVFFRPTMTALDAVEAWRARPGRACWSISTRRRSDCCGSAFPKFRRQARAAILFEQEMDSRRRSANGCAGWSASKAAGALVEDSWFATTAADRERFRRFRHTLPELVNDTVRRRGVMKMNTDYAVPLARNREMLAYYRRAPGRGIPGAVRDLRPHRRRARPRQSVQRSRRTRAAPRN